MSIIPKGGLPWQARIKPEKKNARNPNCQSKKNVKPKKIKRNPLQLPILAPKPIHATHRNEKRLISQPFFINLVCPSELSLIRWSAHPGGTSSLYSLRPGRASRSVFAIILFWSRRNWIVLILFSGWWLNIWRSVSLRRQINAGSFPVLRVESFRFLSLA